MMTAPRHSHVSSQHDRHRSGVLSRALWCLALLSLTASPATAADFASAWHNTHDRVWLGGDYWANPMEDFRIKDGRVECIRGGANRNIALLTRTLSGKKEAFAMSVRLGKLADGAGSAGFRLGVTDEIDDYRAAALRGRGLNVGIGGDGRLFLGRPDNKAAGRGGFPAEGLELRLVGEPKDDGYLLTLTAHEIKTGKELGKASKQVPAAQVEGVIALFHEGAGGRGKGNRPGNGGGKPARFWFSGWKVSGKKVQAHSERAFGPILWAMHTLSDSRSKDGHVLKLTAQMPPMGEKDSREIRFKMTSNGGRTATVTGAFIDPLACTATFRVARVDPREDHPYEVWYTTKLRDGTEQTHRYKGTIRKAPVDRPLSVAGFTGNQDYVFPNLELTRNLAIQNPDMLFFSGDQIYEGVGGYGIIREPADMATLNYLRKWYLLGWSFGDLMRDRPTVCLPDDHDVYHGNIWGEAGMKMPPRGSTSTSGGYRQPAAMVNAVHLTQCSHHPNPLDPADTKPLKQGITPFYTDMVYGRVSFAIISDRQFKSAPGHVSHWKGRTDHLKDPKYDVSKLDKQGLELLGKRQEAFLNKWAADWRGADLKCVLSQTIFCNLANYHGGNQEFIFADLDSNGWPQSGRKRALEAMRRGVAFHYAGDQHLASITQNGIDTWNDAGYAFCVPSIAAGYPRSWRPDKEGRPVRNRVKHPNFPEGIANTGEYQDGFRNYVTVHGLGNPAVKKRKGKVLTAHDKASGHGMVYFDQKRQTIKMECWRLIFDAKNPKPGDQFPGWPKTIAMGDNDGRKAKAYLPTLQVKGSDAPVIQVTNEATGEVLYTLRVRSDRFIPKVFGPGSYTVTVSDPEQGKKKTIKGVKPAEGRKLTLHVEL